MALNKPQQFVFDSTQKINLFMGGTGSGKTFLDGIISAYYIHHFPNVSGFIGANTYEQLNTSTLKRIRDVWRDVHGWQDGKHYVIGKRPPQGFNLCNHNFDRYDSIISFRNGAVYYKGSLDNYEAHSGKEFGVAFLDETKDTKEEAVKEVILHRLRQPGIVRQGKPLTPLYITTTPAKVDWINEWFQLDDFESDILGSIYEEDNYFRHEYENKCVAVCSIHHNRENLPGDYISTLIHEHSDREGNLKESGKRLIFANPFVKAGGEFYSSFDRTQHTGVVEHIEGEPIHISFDFNVVPYMTLTCYQIISSKDKYTVRVFDEFCLPSPDNTTEKITQEFLKKYEKHLKAGLFYYGDPTGTARDTRSRRNDYDIIEDILRGHINNYSRRVAFRAPAVIQRRDFVNNIFDERYDICILVGRNCKKLIADFEYLKEDADGKKLKQKVIDKETKQSYEKYGHTSDSFDYFITEAFAKYFKR